MISVPKVSLLPMTRVRSCTSDRLPALSDDPVIVSCLCNQPSIFTQMADCFCTGWAFYCSTNCIVLQAILCQLHLQPAGSELHPAGVCPGCSCHSWSCRPCSLLPVYPASFIWVQQLQLSVKRVQEWRG